MGTSNFKLILPKFSEKRITLIEHIQNKMAMHIEHIEHIQYLENLQKIV